MTDGGPPWQRLHSRTIWVDVARSLLSLTPAALALWVFDTAPGFGGLWPLLAIAVFGVLGAVNDAVRWMFTRYRITDGYVERRTGVVVRSYRSIQRDRIRSVDIEAKLRHRLSGLRVVNIGAGQQTAAGESALVLDAVLTRDAEALRHLLLRRRAQPPVVDVDGTAADDETAAVEAAGHVGDEAADEQVITRLRPRWVVYNLSSIWAHLFMGLGLLGAAWGGYWLAGMVGFNVTSFVRDLADWEALGWGWTIAIALGVVGAFSVIGLAISFFTEHWGFELARVPGENGTLLRTRQGMFTTREINRDDNRMRGVQIVEPVLWRWMGMADTTVITTGLSEWSMAQPTTILPRGPIGVARPVAAAVLAAEPDPLAIPLNPHPRAALQRRLWWATAVTAAVTGMLGWLAVTGVIPAAAVWAGIALWPVALAAAVVAYRALGHAIAGSYLVVRSGLTSRATTVLQRQAVSTIAIRESLLQRRLGLQTVTVMTAAGYGAYDAPDLPTHHAATFATRAAPGLLDPFLATGQVGHPDDVSDQSPALGASA